MGITKVRHFEYDNYARIHVNAHTFIGTIILTLIFMLIIYREFNAKKEIKQYYNDSLIISYHEQTQAYKRNCKNDPMCLVYIILDE